MTLYCRLCADIKSNCDLIKIFASEEGNVAEKISTLFQIQINENNDQLPNTVCVACLNQLNMCYKFTETVRKAQTILRQLTVVKKECNDDNQELKQDIENDSDSNTGSSSLRSERKWGEELDDDNFDVNADDKYVNEGKSKRATVFSVEVWRHFKLTCDECPEDIISVQHLRNHYSQVHKKPAVYKCSECKVVRNSYRVFYKHISRHFKRNYEHRCNICGKSWLKREAYERHTRIHHESGELPSCKLCGKTFKSADSLNYHSRLHLPDEQKQKFQCEICNKMFATVHVLKNHTKIHTGERELFYCDQCGKSFKSKGNVNNHKILIHTDDRKFQCDQCGKSYKFITFLRDHIKAVHERVLPFKCTICEKSFAKRSILNKHSVTHSSVFSFECNVCKRCFKRSRDRRDHMKRIHGYILNKEKREYTIGHISSKVDHAV